MVSRLAWQRNKIYTVGFAVHGDAFFNLLVPRGITLLIDVRPLLASRERASRQTGSRQIGSRFGRALDRSPLAEQTLGRGMRYLDLGRQLGGRPVGDRFYDDDGFVRYDLVSESPEFLAGIKRIERESAVRPLVLVGGEEDPVICHRRRLVGRVLQGRGAEVVHLRGDGRTQTDAEVATDEAARKLSAQRMLFEADESNSWKSLQSVLRKRRQPTFSGD
jgi:hypothetical protein